MKDKQIFDALTSHALSFGATKAAVIAASEIPLDRQFREMCAVNACGVYGKCWMCPPDVGEIDKLMAEVRGYDHALVYQTVTSLEDSFDYEGMIEARRGMSALSQRMRKAFDLPEIARVLHLSVGGCGVCEECTKKTGEPCRHPELAMPSLEAYGVNVSGLASVAGMKYINGQDTVTYFGAVLFDLKDLVTVTVDGKAVSARSGELLSEIIAGEKPCGGHGRCGKCRVIATGELSEISDAERRLLSDGELARGIRLACMTRALGDCRVEREERLAGAQILSSSAEKREANAPAFSQYGAAIDVGTTTLAATLLDRDGKRLAEAACMNPQSRWGADVVSRIEASLAGALGELSEAIREALNGLLSELCLRGGVSTEQLDGLVITGNTVMLALLCGDDTDPFSHAPFAVSELYGKKILAKELGLTALSRDALVYLPPCIAAFVGADTTCAILAVELCGGDTAMLADIGTNGELALYHGGRLTVCSTAAGPAFEGVGISSGMRGEKGAVDRVTLVNGNLHCHVIGDGEPKGICGSGLIDAVACLLRAELVDESGYMEDESVPLAGEISLTDRDIRAVQLAKSAISAGLMTLAEEAGLSLDTVSELRIAGGFGNYLNKESAVAIGLIPKALGGHIRVCGNAALSGAERLLLDVGLRERADALARSASVCNLASNPIFSARFIENMSFEL